ncbi:MAG: SLBB domain-containing protein, partial [Burkholderiaceae bacterium]
RIVVQEATYNRFTVDGSVASPGVFELKPGMTFMQAVAMAGGVTELTDKTNATLFRRDQSGNFRRYAVNLQAIREGLVPDPLLERDDRIVMAEDGTKTFLRDASRFVNPIKLF